MKYLKLATIAAAALFIGCGGGSGSSSSSDTSNIKLASPTEDNIKTVALFLTQNSFDMNDNIVNAIDGGDVNPLMLVLNLSKPKTLPLNEVFNEKESCDVSGYIEYSGDYTEKKGGYIIYNVVNCDNGDGVVINGKYKEVISNYVCTNEEDDEENYKDHTWTFLTDFTIKGESFTKVIKANTSFNTTYSFTPECKTENIKFSNVNFDGLFNNMPYGIRSGEYIMNYNPESISYEKGDIIAKDGYAKIIKTITPFEFDGNGYTIINGALEMQFDANATVKIYSDNGVLKADIDENGDNVIDQTITLN